MVDQQDFSTTKSTSSHPVWSRPIDDEQRPTPCRVIVWGSRDVEMVEELLSLGGWRSDIEIHGWEYETHEALFQEIAKRAQEENVTIETLCFQGHGSNGSTELGGDLNVRSSKMEKAFPLILPWLSHGAEVMVGGCGTGFGDKGLALLHRIATMGKSKSIKVSAGTVAQRGASGLEGNEMWMQYKGETKIGGVEYGSMTGTQRWLDSPLLVSAEERSLLRYGTLSQLPYKVSGRIETNAMFRKIVKQKNKGSYVKMPKSFDPFMSIRINNDRKRPWDAHVKLFSQEIVNRFKQMREIDRAALCGEFAGDYNLTDVETARTQDWFRWITKYMSAEHSEAFKTLYANARRRAKSKHPEIFGAYDH